MAYNILLYVYFNGDDDIKHRKRLHRRKANKQRKIIILSLFTTLLCLSVGYSVFSTDINLSAKGNLKELDVSNFITSNVVNMEYMFSSTYNIEELNLCNFDTKNISRVDHMFAYTNNLKNVYVGTNWKIPENANSSNMFTDSNISSVTTGKCNS